MSSRFFAASDSSSEESSEEELYSNDEASEQEDSDKDSDDDSDDDDDSSSGSEAGGANRFLKDADSDSDSEDDDTGKVLKSGKDKRFDELEASIRQIENAQKINDWAVISERTSFPTRFRGEYTRLLAGHIDGNANMRDAQNSIS
jgi:translation initiation factor 3 subunit C